MVAAEKKTGLCPYCGTEMKNTGAPIWEDYCPKDECTGHADELKARLRASAVRIGEAERIRAAAPDLLAACNEAFDFLGGVDGATDMRGKLLAAIAKAEGRT